jgi:hypothetical protein
MIPQDVLLAAARRGTAVHKAIHYWLDGDLDEATVEPGLIGYLDAAKRFIDESGFEPMQVECRGYHPAHRYGYTFDLDGTLSGGDLAVVDWKSGMVLEGHAFQLAGYTATRANPRIYRRLAVKLNADGTYKVHEYPSPEYPGHTFTHDKDVFLSALTCAKWNQSRGKDIR